MTRVKYFVIYSAMLCVLAGTLFRPGTLYKRLCGIASNKIFRLVHMVFLLFTIFMVSDVATWFLLGGVRDDEASVITNGVVTYVVDTMFVLSSFGNTVSIQSCLSFAVILAIRCMEWLVDQRAAASRGWRVVICSLFLSVISMLLLAFNVSSSSGRSNIRILYAYEFGINVLCGVKGLFLVLFERNLVGDTKVLSGMYCNITYQALRLLLLLAYFVYMSLHVRIPFNTIREINRDFRELIGRIKGLLGLLRVYMDIKRWPDVPGETCPICQDRMNVGKRMVCGHVFHGSCLKRWAESQQVCPICRAAMFTDEINLGNSEENIIGVPIELG